MKKTLAELILKILESNTALNLTETDSGSCLWIYSNNGVEETYELREGLSIESIASKVKKSILEIGELEPIIIKINEFNEFFDCDVYIDCDKSSLGSGDCSVRIDNMESSFQGIQKAIGYVKRKLSDMGYYCIFDMEGIR